MILEVKDDEGPCGGEAEGGERMEGSDVAEIIYLSAVSL